LLNRIKKYLKEITAETYTLVGLAIAYFTLDGGAKKVTGILVISGFLVWLVTIPLREEDKD
jgi:hypothetical protein